MPILTKTCSSCGLQKPLSAFLEMAGPQGTTYGNICASCRKSNREKAASKKADDDSTSKTGFNIDSEEKTKSEQDKLKLRHEVEDRYYKERDEAEKRSKIKTEKVKEIVKKEREHRTSFLDKTPYKEPKGKKTEAAPNSPAEIAYQEEHPNPQAQFIDTQFAGKRKYTESPFFNAWLTWVDKTSPLAQAALRAAKNKGVPQGKSEKDALNFAEKNWEKEKPGVKRPKR